eukprot:gene1957-1420_t
MSVELDLTTSPHQNNGSSYESLSTNTPGDDNETRELVSHVVVADEEAPADLGSDKAVGSADATKYESFLGRWIRKLGFNVEDNDYSDVNVPKLSYWQIFKIFLWFGCRAFGGPVAHIAMMKQELVVEAKWISTARFNRVYSVYQVLPGPEATEIACYFGYLAGGRFGAFLGGLGFLLPGFSALMVISYLYVNYGLDSPVVKRSFSAIQIAVSAMIFRATHKLAEGTLIDAKKELDWDKGFYCLFCFLTSVINLNFFIALAVCGVMNTIVHHGEWIPHRHLLNAFIAACTLGFYVLYTQLHSVPSGSLVGGDAGTSTAIGTSLNNLFVLGLIAGLVTFGGAYTTLPFIYTTAVETGKWLTPQQFLDAVAITNMLPTPLVMFVTLVGYIGHRVEGAVIMTIGIFLPAFSFTIIGHDFFQAVVDNKYVEPFLDGISAAVIGLLLFTAFQFLNNVLVNPIDAVVFLLAFVSLFYFTNKYTAPLVLIVAAIAGQVLYK